ncbi:hypothetical protein BKA65DRAFT_34093 [Rhexocercosporidium sp. MPI-PUGE-AT-0058]|nr:hypothetical protein BKA65DRAFT_34093 [Rhexocercosporidium sp. MPI-PUGE-AT-0058]
MLSKQSTTVGFFLLRFATTTSQHMFDESSSTTTSSQGFLCTTSSDNNQKKTSKAPTTEFQKVYHTPYSTSTNPSSSASDLTMPMITFILIAPPLKSKQAIQVSKSIQFNVPAMIHGIHTAYTRPCIRLQMSMACS